MAPGNSSPKPHSRDPEKGAQHEPSKRTRFQKCFEALSRRLQGTNPCQDDGIEGSDFQHAKLAQYLDHHMPCIFESLVCHESFLVNGGHKIKGLPKFHALDPYGLDGPDELQRWKNEANRLAKAASSPNAPVLEAEDEPYWAGQDADTEGFNNLHILAQQFYYALEICTFDNQQLLRKHLPSEADEEAFKEACSLIGRVYNKNDEGQGRYGRPLGLAEYNKKTFDALVDYITAVIVRVITRSLDGTLWVNNTIATLAKFSAKIKFLLEDLTGAFQKAMDKHLEDEKDNSRKKAEDKSNTEAHDVSEISPRPKDLETERNILKESIYPDEALYFFEMARCGDYFGALLKASIRDLMVGEGSWQRPDSFETCSIIYKTGFEERRQHLCEKRDGSIGGTESEQLVNLAGVAFRVASEIWNELPSYGTGKTGSSLTWKYTVGSGSHDDGDHGHGTQSRCLATMKDMIQALVPYVLYCGSFSSDLSRLGNLMMWTRDPGSATTPMRYYKFDHVTTYAKIATWAYQQGAQPAYPSASVIPGLITNSAQPLSSTPMADRAKDGKSLLRLDPWEIDEVMSWDIAENTIGIPNRWYGDASSAFCLFIIFGGLALIAIQDGLKGVDPSSLTALTWAAAGFVMTYFKSRKLRDWPWGDFLTGLAVCRTVFEVKKMTGMDEQKIIAILLRLQGRLRLQVQGPFNNLFTRQDAEGFSINFPLETKTAIFGGRLLVQVETLVGPQLVAIKTVKTAMYDWITPIDEHDGGRYICLNIREPLHYNGGHLCKRKVAVYPIRRESLAWLAIRGVFVGKALFN